MEYIIDAQGKSLGRIASGAAAALRGKKAVNFSPHKVPVDLTVKIVNAKLVRLSQKKADMNVYREYSGYPGGLSLPSINEVISQHGYEEIFRRAIKRMLPANKLRPLLLERLSVQA